MQRQYRQQPKRFTTFENFYRPQLQASLGTTPTFAGILQHHVRQYEQKGKIADYYALQQGTAQLTTAQQCSTYLAAYGDMHRLKLDSAFDVLFAKAGKLTNGIEVIDWGCGQGLASGVLLDYVRERQIPVTVRRFTLVEPSAITLSRAVDHLYVLADRSTVVKSLQTKADTAVPTLLATDPAVVKIHLFSNLLDMPAVDYVAIARVIQSSQTGFNWFVCVSPAITDSRNQRLRHFRNQFSNAQTLSERTDSFRGSVFRLYQKAYTTYSIQRTECLFTVHF